jgi:hypothetical protein
VTIPALLLHEIFPSDGFILALLLLVCAIGVGFAFVGVFICRKYGPAALAMSTVGFCLALFILVTSNDRDLGMAAAFPIFGGLAQALVIGYRTYDGGGRSLVVEALIGGAVFVGSIILALIIAGIISGM